MYRTIVNNCSIDRFGDVIDVFKHEIELRTETKDIKYLFRKNNHSISLKFIDLNIFYQVEDVESLGLVINDIFLKYKTAGIDRVIIEKVANKIILQPFIDDLRYSGNISFSKIEKITVAKIFFTNNSVIFEYRS